VLEQTVPDVDKMLAVDLPLEYVRKRKATHKPAYIRRIERKIARLNGAVTSEASSLDDLADKVHLQAQAILDESTIGDKLADYISVANKFAKATAFADKVQASLDTFEASEESEADAEEETRSWFEWIPGFGDFIEAGEDFLDSGAKIGMNVKAWAQTSKAVKAALTVTRAVGTLGATASSLLTAVKSVHDGLLKAGITPSILQDDWVKGSIVATITGQLSNGKAISLNSADGEHARRVPHPTCRYFLAPLLGQDVSHKVVKFVDYLPEYFRKSVLATGLVPAHGYLIVEYYMTELVKTCFEVDVGGGIDYASLLDKLLKGESWYGSFFNYQVTHWTRASNSEAWVRTGDAQVTGEGFWSEGVQSKSRYREVLSVPVHVTYEHLCAFLKSYKANNPNGYNLFTNNCQTMSMEVMDYIEDGEMPDWWTAKASVQYLNDIGNEVFLGTNFGGAVVSQIRGHGLNHVYPTVPGLSTGTTPRGDLGTGANQHTRAVALIASRKAAFLAKVNALNV